MSEYKKNKKKLISITLDPDLVEWHREYAGSVRKSVSGLFNEYIFELSCSVNSNK